MGDVKKTLSTIRNLLSNDGDEAHFLFEPGPPPHIEFGRSKLSSTAPGAAIGMARREGDAIYLAPKVSKEFKVPELRSLNKALKSKLSGVLFALGDAPSDGAAPAAVVHQDDNDASEDSAEQPAATTSTADQPGGAASAAADNDLYDDDDDDRSEDTSHLKGKGSSASGDPKVAALMDRIMSTSRNLMSRNDLPPQLAAIQAALNNAAVTSTGNPRQLKTAFQKLRVAAMAFDAEREAAQTASTSEYGNIPQGLYPEGEDLPPLPQTPEEARGPYGNVPKGRDAMDQNQGPLPDPPPSDYGDLLLAEDESATGYDGDDEEDNTYVDLDLVPKPDDDDTPAAPAAAATTQAQNSPYDAITKEQLEEYDRSQSEQLAELEDMFNDTIKATIDKISDRLEGTIYARGTDKSRYVLDGLLRFQEVAESPNPNLSQLRHIIRLLRTEIVEMIKAIKAKSPG